MTRPLPAEGGSYTREADGTLSPATRADRPGPAPVKPAVKPAVKRPVKEA